MMEAGRELRAGRYVITRLLGEGTQGHTLEAVDKQAGRLVAVKCFQVRGARTWKDVELAEREARVLEALSHPGLPAHVEHFEEDGALYLVMEKIEGESVTALRRRAGALGREEAARFLRDAAGILDYLHGRAPPIIHRDIKPGNVIRRPDGSFALVDFGAVRDRLRPEGGSTVVGTFGFMAPEQFQGRALPGSDVYAVGATALAMLTGEEPEALPHRGLAIDVAAALKGRADPALVEVLTAMLEPDPDRRPSKIGPLLAKLGAGGGRPAAAGGREAGGRDARARGERRGRERREDEARGEQPRARGRGEERQARQEEQRARQEEQRARWEERRAHREERRARREEHRAWREEARGVGEEWDADRMREAMERASRELETWLREARLSGMALGLVTLGLMIARVATHLALQVVVPAVLTLLSILFGRALREAAGHVRETGQETVRMFDRGLAVLRDSAHSAGAASAASAAPRRARVEDPADPAGRVRVEDPDEEAAREREAEAEAEAQQRASRRR